MNRAAIRYAKAVLSLAQDQKVEDKVNADMKLISNTITNNAALSEMIQNPVVKLSEKKTVLNAVFSNTAVNTRNLVDTLIANKRLTLLNDVASSYVQQYNDLRGSQVAVVTTAIPLTDELRTKVLAKVKTLTGKEAEIKSIVDETILGGFILRVGDVQYNASIANQLNNLKREFTIN
jgi:F-type H+-transporting ATPase subunit delta